MQLFTRPSVRNNNNLSILEHFHVLRGVLMSARHEANNFLREASCRYKGAFAHFSRVSTVNLSELSLFDSLQQKPSSFVDKFLRILLGFG